MRLVVIVCALLICGTPYVETKGVQGLLFPEELITILNLVYSILPPVNLGSDKRFGVGFRVGKNIDAQILVELGPQSETQKLADASPPQFSSKREAMAGSSTTEPVFSQPQVQTTGAPLKKTKKRPRKRKKLPKPTNGVSRRSEDSVREAGPVLDVFMKWLTRLSRTGEDNVRYNLIRK